MDRREIVRWMRSHITQVLEAKEAPDQPREADDVDQDHWFAEWEKEIARAARLVGGG